MRIMQTSSASETVGVRLVESWKYTYRPVQITMTSTADVSIQGKISEAHDWVELYQVSDADAIEMVAVTRQMRAVVTNNVGTVTVGIDVREK